MLMILSFGWLVVAAIVLLVLRQLNINRGRIWLAALGFSIFQWGILLALRWFIPLEQSITKWFPLEGLFVDGIVLKLDVFSWSLAFAISAVQLAIILTDSTRMEELPTTNVWSGICLISAMGIVAVLCSSVLSILLVWAMVDVTELVVILRTVKTEKSINEAVSGFSIRFLGSIVLIIAVMASYSLGTPLDFNHVTGNIGMLVIIAVGFRMGVLPLNLPYANELPFRRGIGNAIRNLSVMSSLVVLIRFSGGMFVGVGENLLFTLVSLAAFFAAVMWLVARNELEGRPFWIISMAALAIYSCMAGNSPASLAWGLSLVLNGSVLFLYSTRTLKIQTLPLLAVIGFSGLPFTPSATGWVALIAPEHIFQTLLNVFSVLLLIFGYLRLILKSSPQTANHERWVWIIYPLGLFFPIITQWLIFFLSGINWFQTGVVWASVFAFLVPLLLVLVLRRLSGLAEYSEWIFKFLEKLGDIVTGILKLNWLYKIFGNILAVFRWFTELFSRLLEEQGGIMWVFVLVALLITLLKPAG